MAIKKELVRMKLQDLKPYLRNPRRNDAAVRDVAESIEQCGDLDPIEIDEEGVILSGHTRLKALQRRGETETDVIRYTGLTEEQKRKYRLLTNKTGEKASWNKDLLATISGLRKHRTMWRSGPDRGRRKQRDPFRTYQIKSPET